MLTKSDLQLPHATGNSSLKEDVLHRLPIGTLACVLWLTLSFIYYQARSEQILVSWSNPDDALRLLQIRQWLAGASWFDLHIPRMGFDQSYLSHWSRLIDAPIGAMITLFGLFLMPARAEYWALVIWPLLPFALTIVTVVKTTELLGGRYAALLALFSILFLFAGHVQFMPGTIDHHNVQIMLAMAFIYASLRAPHSQRWAMGAGAIAALALVIGIESLAILALAVGAYVLRFVFDPHSTRHLKPFGLSLALSAVGLFVLTIPPSLYGLTACDAFAVNWLGLILTGGLGLALMDWAQEQGLTSSWPQRLALAAGIGGLAIGVFLGIEPACVKGPFAQFDPRLFPLWLDHTQEMYPLARVFAQSQTTGLVVYYFPIMAAFVAILLCLRDRRVEIYCLTALLLIALILGCINVRQIIYAHWLAVILVSLYAFSLLKERLWSFDPRSVGFLFLLNPFVLPSVPTLAMAVTQPDSPQESSLMCFQAASFQKLAGLPAGLVFADVNLASMILLLTPHRIVAGPYHRLNADIVFAKEMMQAEPKAALAALRARGVDYVVNCTKFTEPIVGSKDPDKALFSALIAEQVPDDLERVHPAGQDLQIWRIKPKAE
ncbi:MAG: hypothetical protein EBY21_04010 [Alphaproteobacteria bacterium]|nr:hypothetical protein [Alphaproteobacteria bacterium]